MCYRRAAVVHAMMGSSQKLTEESNDSRIGWSEEKELLAQILRCQDISFKAKKTEQTINPHILSIRQFLWPKMLMILSLYSSSASPSSSRRMLEAETMEEDLRLVLLLPLLLLSSDIGDMQELRPDIELIPESEWLQPNTVQQCIIRF